MPKDLLLMCIALCPSFCHAQNGNTGIVELYRTGKLSVALPVTVDGQVKIKVSHAKKVKLILKAGDHQIESKLGNLLNPVLFVHVEPGETAYVVMYYSFPTFIGSAKDLHLTFEHTNRPPDGEFKEEELTGKDKASLEALPPFHEDEPLLAQHAIESLTDQEVRDALLQGRHTPRPTMVGLYLEDVGTRFASALSSGQSVSGFSIYVYSAKQWLQLKAAVAQHEMRPFTEADVAPEDRQRLLHVLARPSTPGRLDARNMAVAENADRVVLEEGPSRAVVQPIDLKPANFQLDSALRSADYQGVVASFPEPDITKPFRVVVIGPVDRKEFEVKEKHLGSLK